MGWNQQRFWDDRTFTSRAARPTDPKGQIFSAFVPHLISGWAPELQADTWQRITTAAERCEDLAISTAGTPGLASEWLLDRAESIASSTIEEIRPSARRVARAEAQLSLFGTQPPLPEMEALRNIATTKKAGELAASGADLTIDALCEIHATLTGDDDPIAGQIRDRQNWVGGGALGGPLEARHVGPPPELVHDLLEDLIEFVNGDGIPLVRAAIAHAQFETVHPFPDGNGRTGRALIQYMYLRYGVIGSGALPVSSSLMLNKERYFDALDLTRIVCEPDVPQRSQAFRPWIELLAEATNHACVLRSRLITHVESLAERWAHQARSLGIRTSSAAFRLLQQLPQHPVVTVDSTMGLLCVDKRTAQRAVARVAAAGVLEQRSAGRRNRVFECRDMMDAFNESVRQQPAQNLTLSTPSKAATAQMSGTCGAPTNRGGTCGHPQPSPGGRCQAGHRRAS
ncbi:Fic family protein [Candidatus Poriferisodalis sp.]|uniref:Fic family protein n=1 Tax=Candidatus Poriferisodalis sp. TaxID=3101277 RepID=UPI003B5CEFF0